MTKRILSSVVMAGVLIPILLKGGLLFTTTIYLVSLFILKEFLDMKEIKKELPDFIWLISYVFMTLLIFFNVSSGGKGSKIILTMDFRVIAGLFLIFLIPTVLYHDRKKYSINDAFYLIGGTFFLWTSLSLFILFRNYGIQRLLYLLLITIITDAYAYFVGMLIGKHKLIESVSPKKTWEGTIGGTLFAIFIGVLFYHTVIDSTLSLGILVLITAFLSMIGQFGDLFFSAIKRYYNKKDFSHLIPGHGGILDRLDSIIFVILAYTFFV